MTPLEAQRVVIEILGAIRGLGEKVEALTEEMERLRRALTDDAALAPRADPPLVERVVDRAVASFFGGVRPPRKRR